MLLLKARVSLQLLTIACIQDTRCCLESRSNCVEVILHVVYTCISRPSHLFTTDNPLLHKHTLLLIQHINRYYIHYLT